MKQPTISEVLALLRELEKLGVKRAEYSIRSPWDRTGPRLTDAPQWREGLRLG